MRVFCSHSFTLRGHTRRHTAVLAAMQLYSLPSCGYTTLQVRLCTMNACSPAVSPLSHTHVNYIP